jgi:site-specific recombinase XerD
MLDQVFRDGAAVHRLRATLLGPYLDAFTARVSQLGYAQSTIRLQLWLLAGLGRWLTRTGRKVSGLGGRVTDEFIGARRRARRLRRGDAETLRLFLAHLRAEGVIRAARPVADRSPLGRLKSRYEEYLYKERGLSPATGHRQWFVLRRFLCERFGDGPLRLRDLKPHDVTQFLLRHPPCPTPKGGQLHVSALRSFLRFLFQQEDTDRDLSAVVPLVRRWRLVDVPKHLTAAEVERLLGSCDRTSPVGRRNYAVLLLLARLGLRAGEVVHLELGDLDWRSGELMVRGKGLVHDRLPLPRDVGTALAAYLRTDRPRCPTRRVFLRMKAPHRGFHHPSTVSTIVRRALERAGLTPPIKGAHLLRHSLATDLLSHGASLADIGEVLRHRVPSTTEIYAKVDLNGLRPLARPWPMLGGER